MAKKIIIQRGHVPRTSGATGAPGEQQFAIDTAARLKPKLEAIGLQVRVINADEPDSTYQGDMFVAIHYDSSGSSSASGASVGYQNSQGKKFADLWKKYYRAAGWTRGFRADNYTANLSQYYGVREAIQQGNLPAIITESGFHSNSGDKALLSPERTATSIANAINEYLGVRAPMSDFGPENWDAADWKRLRSGLLATRTGRYFHNDPDKKRPITIADGIGLAARYSFWTLYVANTIKPLAKAAAECRALTAEEVKLIADAAAAAVPEEIAEDVVDELNERLDTP